MLVLTRKIGESLVIGEQGLIITTVLSVRGQQVQIGIEAPKQIPVHRDEIFRLLQRQKQQESHGVVYDNEFY